MVDPICAPGGWPDSLERGHALVRAHILERAHSVERAYELVRAAACCTADCIAAQWLTIWSTTGDEMVRDGSEAKRFSAHSGGLSLQAVQVFMERKILGRVFGAEAEQFAAHGGFLSLQAEVAKFGKEHPFTALVPDLSGGIDPDDAFSRIPYEKGFHFLYHLQTIVGGAGVFEPFMKAYIEKFALKTVTTDEFKAFLLEYFAGNEALAALDWDAWLFRPGALLALWLPGW